MLTGLELMSCPNQAVPAEVMHHIVHVESGYNPFAIGVVGGHLIRQPQRLDEAVATVQMLESKGFNYSLGVAQVNRSNLAKYGLDTYAKAFDPCLNLSVGSRILNECYYSSGADWGKAFSCYYSGDFITGFRQGYVQKVFASMGQQALRDGISTAPIPLQVSTATEAQPTLRAYTASTAGPPGMQQDAASYRVSLRSTSVLATDSAPVVAAAVPISASDAKADTAPAAPSATSPKANAAINKASADTFVPKVTRVGDRPTAPPAEIDLPNVTTPAAAAQAAAPNAAGDPTDLRQIGGDDAFVF